MSTRKIEPEENQGAYLSPALVVAAFVAVASVASLFFSSAAAAGVSLACSLGLLPQLVATWRRHFGSRATISSSLKSSGANQAWPYVERRKVARV